MWPLSTAAANAVRRSHSMTARAIAHTAAIGDVPNIPISGGSVSVDATSQVRRTATVSIPHSRYWPTDPFAIFSPLGSEMQIDYGIVLPGGSIEWVPLIRGPITDVSRTHPISGASAALEVEVSDRSSRVAEAKFDQPVQTVLNATVIAEIRRLITEVLPTVTVTDTTASTQVAAQIDIERERWADGVEKLADSISAECFADPVGQFVIRPQPLLTNAAVWTLAGGQGGVLVGLDEEATRDLAYSRVVASGQRTDGTPPVWAAVSDTDPASPTYVGGPFGVKTRFYASQLLTTVPQCTTAATGLLERTRGMQGSVTITAVVNPALDAGDVIVVRHQGTVTAHIIDELTVPLSSRDPQRISTRTLELPPEF